MEGGPRKVCEVEQERKKRTGTRRNRLGHKGSSTAVEAGAGGRTGVGHKDLLSFGRPRQTSDGGPPPIHRMDQVVLFAEGQPAGVVGTWRIISAAAAAPMVEVQATTVQPSRPKETRPRE